MAAKVSGFEKDSVKRISGWPFWIKWMVLRLAGSVSDYSLNMRTFIFHFVYTL